ncbi:DUF3662 and FHA domain-containing protein [Corynebacterium propinquum]|jgi:FHA domain protein|uniref:DUF3662 and FHA domain-containing protein n=2 Tax=Corynebacterium propinquum TaxID=43769 RepID=A0AAP4BTP8_9CORY|nr:DUF3662 and FHA domain-containing protein [Corynebacterium propinquum]MCG7231464.1 DUF3662 and FHA domain-containing protein [Corynebacterium propinquum]MCT1819032.1 DUF3662 and FHA domain-containing protein [Corynebacterium propinquum]MDK4252696.1 DUF3662 and FHA domain-containing protein [Corynebacterium propinquum]MDK4258749.1 DUF3662 and FHA domain-containing protein [Corynebacterium propinquum]MDK4282999.1 DUF3662 and FHA domain-containing protein [Corynebacterium propinquum]
MALMSRFAKLDSAMQRGLDNGIALIFGGKVVPAEIEELLKQEAQDNLSATARGYVPNVYAVGVSSKDLENLSRDRQLPISLADQLARFLRNEGMETFGPVIVRIAEESGLRTGQLRVSSFADAQPVDHSGFDAIITHDDNDNPENDGTGHRTSSQQEESPAMTSSPYSAGSNQPAAQDATTTMFRSEDVDKQNRESQNRQPEEETTRVSLMLQDGSSRSYLVEEGSNVIGRSNDADLRIPDTGVSRQHAEITWDGRDAILVDLQSTNGTTVNDTPIENWLLADGDVITVGHSHIEVRITYPNS